MSEQYQVMFAPYEIYDDLITNSREQAIEHSLKMKEMNNVDSTILVFKQGFKIGYLAPKIGYMFIPYLNEMAKVQ